MSENNPLLQPYDLPPFSAIRPEHVQPAIEQILADNRAGIQTILADQGQNPTWAGLVLAMDELNDRLGAAWSPVSHLNAVCNSAELREAYEACLPALSAYSTEMGQNRELFQAFEALAHSPQVADFDQAQKTILEHSLRDFRLSGIDLPEAEQKRYAEVQSKLSELGSKFSNQLLMADLAPLIGADSNTQQKARGGESKQPAGKVLPVEEFRTERWRDMDADVELTGKRIVQSAELPFTDLYTHVVLNDGELSLEPLRFGVAGGKLDAQIRLNGRVAPLKGNAKLTARNFKLKQLFPTFEPMKTSFGELNGDATIAGSGNSVAKLLGTANGDLKMIINDGAISRSLMEIAGLNVGNYVVGKIFGDEDVKINCAAADLGIKNGLANTRLFVFDTENAIIYIDGTINLATEQLDLKITPESKGLRLFSLRSPLYVRGTFANPSAGVQAVPLLLRGAGMVALGVIAGPAAGLLALVAPSGGEPNQCAPLLQQMQQGKVPKTVK